MKKTIYILSTFAALILAGVSCQKEQQAETGNGKLTVTATIADNGTKMAYVEESTKLKLSWEKGDVLIGFDNEGRTYGFGVTSVGSDGKASLERINAGSEAGSAETDPTDGTTLYMFYAPGHKPSDIDVTDPSNPSFTADIAHQDKDFVPFLMMATGTVSDGSLSLTFTSQAAIIGIKSPTMTGAADETQFTSITLSGEPGLNTKVKFDLTGDGGSLKATCSGSGEITKDVAFDKNSIPAVIYFVTCPVVSQTNLKFTANDSEYFQISDRTIQIGNYYYMTPDFEPSERTITIAGLDPAEIDGDLVKVSNGTDEPADCQINSDGSTATFITPLGGDLTIVYPSSKATVSGKDISAGNVSSQQDGSYKDAVIATANVPANSNAATFELSVAMFQVSVPTDAKKLTVKSLLPINPSTTYTSADGGGRRINTTAVAINDDSADASLAVTIGDGSVAVASTCYVGLCPGVGLNNLSFDAWTDDNHGSLRGIPESVITEEAAANSKTFEDYNSTDANTIYTIDDSNWHEYVVLNGLKWATKDVGQTTGYKGLYFMYADVRGYNSGSDFPSTNPDIYRYTSGKWNNTKGFSFENAPYIKSTATNGTSTSNYSKYSSNDYLALMDDAAYYNWGGPWRMPIYSEMSTLNTSTSYTKAKASTANGINITATSDAGISLFLYAKDGYCSSTGTSLTDGFYWMGQASSSNIRYFKVSISSGANITISSTGTSGYPYRHNGLLIRPVAD